MKRANAFVVFAVGILGLTACKKENQSFNSAVSETAGSLRSSGETNNPGAVYLIDNAAGGNHVLVFDRSTTGQLTGKGSVATGGTGTGAGLGSQGAVILDNSNQYLFAVNAGSNEISSLEIGTDGLTWVDKIASAGTMPISLTLHDDILYVLNAGGAGNIHGFRVNQGHFTSIASSDQSLSSSTAGPAQIQFNDEGTALVVTEKNTNTIDVYPVIDGVAGARTSFPSTGVTPFGFAFGKDDEFFVSDANGGIAGQSALTSYSLTNPGNLELLSGPVGTNQTSACWTVVTNNGRFAYTANTGSGTISGFSISNTGQVSLLNSNGITGTAGSGTADMALSNNSRFLFSRNGGNNSISIFEVAASGALSNIGTVTGLPASSVGLAAK